MAKQALTPNMEQYLETIAQLEHEKDVVRVRDIASEMGVTMPSVTAALKTLSDQRFVQHGRYAHVRLTTAGRRAARQVQQRHDVLFEFFTDVLGIPVSVAERDACEMEHFMSSAALERLIGFLELVRTCPYKSRRCLKGFAYYLTPGGYPALRSEASCPIEDGEDGLEGEDDLL